MTSASKPSPKPTRVSRVAEALRQAILKGDLAPGAKVNLDHLRERFDVSLSPMREAMARLVADGLVSFEDQRGYTITPLSRANLAEVTALRADLETSALGHAVERAGLDWESDVLAALHRLDRTRRDPDRPETLEAWETAHTEFHAALIGGCRMPLLVGFCTVLHNLTDRYRRLPAPRVPAGRDGPTSCDGPAGCDGAAEHRAIAEAAVARDGPQAVALLRAHIERTGADLAIRLPPDIH